MMSPTLSPITAEQLAAARDRVAAASEEARALARDTIFDSALQDALVTYGRWKGVNEAQRAMIAALSTDDQRRGRETRTYIIEVAMQRHIRNGMTPEDARTLVENALPPFDEL